MLCPDNDPHSCALYYYTEAGDHIGFHYDTSYYKGARYTILMGLVDRSTQCKLVCELFKDVPDQTPRTLELVTQPGDMVIFNGDKLWHAVTPLGEGEERIALTMEYVTNPEMGSFKRLYSNLKDSFAYFGIRGVFKRALSEFLADPAEFCSARLAVQSSHIAVRQDIGSNETASWPGSSTSPRQCLTGWNIHGLTQQPGPAGPERLRTFGKRSLMNGFQFRQ